MQRRFVAPAVLAAALVHPFSTNAQSTDEATIVVTGSRFLDVDRNAPANVTTLTREDIARTPAGNLPDLLATRAGIDVRSLYGGLGADASANLRGFGENGGLRTLILVDGRRLDSLEFISANWLSIPLESIERIEIVRGSGAVLYGDQAVAGVINIITSRGREDSAQVSATAGSFGYGKLAGSISRTVGAHHVALDIEHVESDEYRRNNAHRSTAASGRVSHDIAGGEVFAEAGASSLLYGLPGTVTASQFDNDPRASETTDSWFKRENQFLRPGVRLQLAPGMEAAAELSLDESHNQSWISNWFPPSYRDVTVRNVSLAPRLRWAHGLSGMSSTTVVGFDWSDARLEQDHYTSLNGARTNTVALDRSGGGFYVRNTTRPMELVTVTIGAREQRYSSRATDTLLTSVSDSTSAKTATELGLIWQAAPAWKLFAKASSTFRYPVLDELTTFGGFALPAPKPESGKGTDVGAEWRAGGHSIQATFYELKMTDEIAWNNSTFQNENLQKTHHRGVEIDSRWRLTRDWRFNLSWNGKTAEFSEGANSGKTIPLVPTQRWTAMLSWDGGKVGTHSLLTNHVGSRYFGGDEANALAQLPAYTTLDWQSNWKVATWDVGLRIANLTNRKYASLGFDYGFGASYYPANPRAGYVTARHQF
ncbi:MAG TPA: TonB-dependent receptor [Rhodocyclaceae bacterium]|nr:TonB-dependent receptor [Rhodocyclaceae bacterium]